MGIEYFCTGVGTVYLDGGGRDGGWIHNGYTSQKKMLDNEWIHNGCGSQRTSFKKKKHWKTNALVLQRMGS
jgi:hypothetical protein